MLCQQHPSTFHSMGRQRRSGAATPD